MLAVDWAVLAAYLLLTLLVGLYFRRRAGGGPEDFFLSGRRLPWWVLGTSMAATTFAADTPLAVTGLTANHGISGNWLWWSALFANVTSAVIFAPLWRRSRCLTDLEFIELRYGSGAARYLRGFLAVYRGLLLNCIVMGWVFLGMGKIMKVFLGWDPALSLGLCLAVVLFYTLLSGLWGVVVTDVLQFGVALAGAASLAWLSVREVGGMGGLLDGLRDRFGTEGVEAILSPVPASGGSFATLSWSAFLIYLLVLWWNKPEVEGTGYFAQRMLAARTERDALLGTLWFVSANYALRTWPWILTALAALILFPGLDDPEMGYPLMMQRVVPAGLLGLVVTSMVAAFMSTIDTHLNWGTSYLVHDLYARFWNRNAPARHYVWVARGIQIALGVIALGLALNMESIAAVWQAFFSMTAGVGLVHVLRWIWWRVNVWTELTVMAASVLATLVLRTFWDLPFEREFLIACGASVGLALLATFLTAPTPAEVRRKFLETVHPPAIFWKGSRPRSEAWRELGRFGRRWSLVTAGNLFFLFAPLYLLTGRPGIGSLLLTAGIVCFAVLLRTLRREPLPT